MEEVKESRGLGDVLQKMRERGQLQNHTEFVGRSKDKNPQEETMKHGLDFVNQDRIKLEYRDHKGRLMTQKEAFRYQCWRFHGKGPSKSTWDKKLKKE